jgi:hypothetical protein
MAPGRRYVVDADAFFAGVTDDPERFVSRKWALRCATAMQGIIARYDLMGARVLSIGSAESFEEYWFYKASCQLTLNDLDKTGSFARYLEQIPPPGNSALIYVIGDANELVREISNPDYDVLYVSSFPPDELRREDTQANYTRVQPWAMKLLARTWPHGTPPYHSILMKAVDGLQPGGLAIFQHYRGGVNIAINRHYIPDVQRQFSKHGLSLLEAYCFRRSPANLLVVAFKGSPRQARQRAIDLVDKPTILEFHGRSENEERKNVIKAFSAAPYNLQDFVRLSIWLVPFYLRRLRAIATLLRVGWPL